MLTDRERQYPGKTGTIFRALGNVAPSHLLDQNPFDFQSLKVEMDDSIGLPHIRVIDL